MNSVRGALAGTGRTAGDIVSLASDVKTGKSCAREGLLLDTHIWIWSFLEPERIAHRIAKALEDAPVGKWPSQISIWECMVLAEKRRLELTLDPNEWIARRSESSL